MQSVDDAKPSVMVSSSDAADLVAEPAARTEHARPGPRPRSTAVGLLRLTGGLFAAYWPVLFFWFLLQHVTHRPLLDASVQLGLFNRPLGFLGLAILVVVQLLCTIAMFQALRPGMSSLTHVGDGFRARFRGNFLAERPSTAPPSRFVAPALPARANFADAIAVALLPFFAYYATWGLLRDIVGQYSYELLRHIAGLGLPGPLDIIRAPGLWVTVAITYFVRRISVNRHERTKSPWWSILATICEAYWVFLGVLAIASYRQMPWDWWHHRVVYVEWQRWWDNSRDVLGPIKRTIDPVLGLATEGIRVAILPLVWLAIAAIVYGHDVRAPGDLTESDARVTRLRAHYARLPRVLQWIAETWSDGWRKKALPVVNSLRLLLRAGLRPALALCVCYVALHFVCSWAFRGAVWLIGPQDRDVWNVILGPLSLLVGDMSGQTRSLIQEPLRICLLAAAVEVTLRENTLGPLQSGPRDGCAADAGSGAANRR